MFGFVNVDCISTYLNAALTDSRINKSSSLSQKG